MAGQLGPAEAEPRPPPRQATTSCLLRQKTLWVKPKFLVGLHYSFKHAGGAAHQPRSLSTPALCEEEAGEERLCRPSPQKLNQPIEIGLLMPLLEERGSTAVLVFTDLSGRVWFCCFFNAIACSAASGFLFLNANVGACFFKIKGRKPK